MTDAKSRRGARGHRVGAALSDRLKHELDERGMSQTQLARASGLSISYINDLVLGRRGNRLSARTAARLGAALSLPGGFFVHDESVITDAASVNASRRRVRQ